MAVAYVSDVEGVWSSGTTMTLSSVGGSGGNVVVVFVTWRQNSGQVVTGVTYGGNAMTQIGSTVTNSGGAIEAWYYITSSDGNVVVTWDIAPPNAQGTALVFSGAHASTPIGTPVTSNNTGTSTSTGAATSETDGMCVDGFFVRGSSAGTGLACDGAQTQRSAQEQTDSIYHRTSTEPGAASVTMSWSWTNSNGHGHFVVPIAPAAGTVIPTIVAYYNMLRNS